LARLYEQRGGVMIGKFYDVSNEVRVNRGPFSLCVRPPLRRIPLHAVV
jgi:hypothetical protein